VGNVETALADGKTVEPLNEVEYCGGYTWVQDLAVG